MSKSGSQQARVGGEGENGIARLESLLVRQESLFVRLDVLSERQAGLIESEQTDRLLDVLAERQVAVDEIASINTVLEPWRVRWSDFIATLSEDERSRIRKRVDAVALLAQRVAQRDEQDRALMERRREAISAAMGQVDRGRGAIAAYSGSPTGHAGRRDSGPRFQDREA